MITTLTVAPPPHAVTDDQVRLVQDSFRLVLPIRKEAAALFYGRLFALDPGTAPLFAGTDLEAQGAKLMAALGFVVGALRRPESMLDTVRALAVRHLRYGVADAHYTSVGASLLWTLEQGLGAACTPEVKAAWAAAYGMLSATMIDAAHAAASSLAAQAACASLPGEAMAAG